VYQIVDILPVLPLRHALVVVVSHVLLPHPARITDEKGADLLLYAEANHLSRGFMAQVTHTSLDAARHGISGTMESGSKSPAPSVMGRASSGGPWK
jgi:hypothetical protein